MTDSKPHLRLHHPLRSAVAALPTAGLALFCALAGALVGPMVGGAAPALAEDQSWLANSATIGLGEGPWKLALGQELRSRGLDYGDVYLQNASFSFVRTLPKGFSMGIGYKREELERSAFDLRENRLMLDGFWGRKLNDRWRFDVRMRNEFRTFESDRADDDLRVRFRFRVRTKAELAKLKLEPFAWTEIFESLRRSGVFERNRLGIGTSAKIRPNLSVQLCYLRQDTEGSETIHGYITGIDLRF